MGRVIPLDKYQLKQRPAPRSRLAACDEVECWAYLNGFEIHVDEATELGQRQAHYLRGDSSRTRPTEFRAGALTVFRYPAGQRCTEPRSPTHWVAVDQFFIARGANTSPELWVEEFGENQQRIAEIQARG